MSAALPNLQETIASPQLVSRLGGGAKDALLREMQEATAAALSELAMVHLAQNQVPNAVAKLTEALRQSPTCHNAFHNLASILLQYGQLRGNNHAALMAHLQAAHDHGEGWAEQYQHLQWLPDCLSLQFIGGGCNLRCRMCVESHNPNRARKFTYVDADLFLRMLEAAPTVSQVQLTARDSDPLLHPQLPRILQICQQRGVRLSLFCNGMGLTEALGAQMLASGIVGEINFSLDAATPETYQRIRGGDFARVLGNLRAFVAGKVRGGKSAPVIQLSLVAMADNIQELPALVELAAELGAGKVFVAGLGGWGGRESENRPASENSQWMEHVRHAQQTAAQCKVGLLLPGALQPPPAAGATAAPAKNGAAAPLSCCDWLKRRMILVNMDGSIDPCCMLRAPVSLGHVHDRPMTHNTDFARVMRVLAEGKVFPQCAAKGCAYVHQQQTAGIPLRFITSEELGVAPAPGTTSSDLSLVPASANG